MLSRLEASIASTADRFQLIFGRAMQVSLGKSEAMTRSREIPQPLPLAHRKSVNLRKMLHLIARVILSYNYCRALLQMDDCREG